MGAGLGSVPAATPTPDFHGLSASQASQVEQAQAEYRSEASAADYQRAVKAFNQMREQGAEATLNSTDPSGSQASTSDNIQTNAVTCITVRKWMIVAYGWYLVGGGAASGITGIILDATGVGAPAGAILNALGIAEGASGSAVLYWADHTSWPKHICV